MYCQMLQILVLCLFVFNIDGLDEKSLLQSNQSGNISFTTTQPVLVTTALSLKTPSNNTNSSLTPATTIKQNISESTFIPTTISTSANTSVASPTLVTANNTGPTTQATNITLTTPTTITTTKSTTSVITNAASTSAIATTVATPSVNATPSALKTTPQVTTEISVQTTAFTSSTIIKPNGSTTNLPTKQDSGGSSISTAVGVILGILAAVGLITIIVLLYKYQRRVMHAIRFRRLQEVPMDDFEDDLVDAVYGDHTAPIRLRV